MGENPMVATERRHHLHIGLEAMALIAKLLFTGIEITKKLLVARTIFTFMFFATTCWLILNKIEVPEILNTIVSTLLGFWYGSRSVQKNDKITNNDHQK